MGSMGWCGLEKRDAGNPQGNLEKMRQPCSDKVKLSSQRNSIDATTLHPDYDIDDTDDDVGESYKSRK